MLVIIPLKEEEKETFIKDMQEAFQKGAEDEFGPTDEVILPRTHIEQSLNGKNAAAYQAVEDGETVGGAIISVDEASKHNDLELLYVKVGCQNRGIGRKIWNEIERMYPDTLVWETVTPYFEKRNLHFYINQCGFHAVEFFCPQHEAPYDFETDPPCDEAGLDYSFRFEKRKG